MNLLVGIGVVVMACRPELINLNMPIIAWMD